jgi:KipI family sensor histidine kinase inhibitor
MTNHDLHYPRLLPVGDAAVTVEFGDAIDPAINDRVLAFTRAVDELIRDDRRGIIEVVPTFRSATVYFDPLTTEAETVAGRLRALADALPSGRAGQSKTVEVPVVYGGEFGPDLGEVAAYAGLSVEEIARLHASVAYRCYMLGFSPGFPYLGLVPEAIAMPRLAEPRVSVPPGSVGIAGSQTGLYPLESPGGWRLIGRTPLRLYDPDRAHPFLIEAGDTVRFVPISRAEFDRLSVKHNES